MKCQWHGDRACQFALYWISLKFTQLFSQNFKNLGYKERLYVQYATIHNRIKYYIPYA